MEDGEKEDKDKEEEQAEYLWTEVTKKKKRRCGQKVEKPEAFTANFFKGLDIYQTKLLVSALALALSTVQALAQADGREVSLICFTVWSVTFPSFLIPTLSSSHVSTCSFSVGGKEKGESLERTTVLQ